MNDPLQNEALAKPQEDLGSLAAELKRHLVADLELDDIEADEIATDEPLFEEGLGLDSIDAVELVVLVERHYGIRLKDMQTARSAFASVGALAEFVATHRER